jgi:hypothetical protein
MKIGKANYSGSNQNSRRKIAKLNDGDNVYRILPPLGSMADKGRWSTYLRVEWGYRDSKNNNRPFQDVRVVNRKTKMVEVESAAFQVREYIAAKLKETTDNYRAGKATQKQVEEAKEKSMQFNLDSKHYVNAVNSQGEIVLLKIGHKAKLTLDAAIKELEAQGVDPLSVDNGRFFNLRRSGRGLDTTVNIAVVKENVKVDGMGVLQRDIIHVLDESFQARLATEATDLGTLDKMYPVISAEDVQEIVKGGPEAVDRILGARNNQESSSASDDGSDEDDAPAASSSPQQPLAASSSPQQAPAKAEPAQAAQAQPELAATGSEGGSAPQPLDKDKFLRDLGL